MASIQVDDWFYGLQDSVAWIDSSGSHHPDGWPSCLKRGNEVTVRFGAVPVTLPDGGDFRAVVYVDCRGLD